MSSSADASQGLLLFGGLASAWLLYQQRWRRWAEELTEVSGGCHCGAVRFKVKAPRHVVVWDCDCSICLMKKNAHFIVPSKNFCLVSGESDLQLYTFNTRQAKHYFCKICGVQSFYVRIKRHNFEQL